MVHYKCTTQANGLEQQLVIAIDSYVQIKLFLFRSATLSSKTVYGILYRVYTLPSLHMIQITHNLNSPHVSHACDTRGVNHTNVCFLDNTQVYTHIQYLHMRVFYLKHNVYKAS